LFDADGVAKLVEEFFWFLFHFLLPWGCKSIIAIERI
jgi:hypothetical protein